ncbi:MAG: glycosyltransferase family 39 protein [Bacteroidota bacterium]
MKHGRKWLLLLPIVVIYFVGMFIDVMEIDAAQYATMSREMTQTGNYLKLYSRGEDYIDKPPMIFWSAALSFNLFGPGNFAYKLPSMLFTILGLFSTYRLGCMYYGRWTGYFAALILASCDGWFQFVNDVRTDAILAGSTIFAIWQLAEYTSSKKISSLFWASLGIAAAMLAKGPIGAMVPALALGTDLLLKRDWRTLFRWQWLLLIPMVFVFIFPMIYGLYEQFDASGGRQTYNGLVTSGLRFYFWTQSFGRLTGDSTWTNDTGPFYFIHTFLWAFLPWCFLFFIALGKKLKKIIFNGFIIKRRNEALTLGGTVLPFIALSMSNYKLPHYIFIMFPLCAILTGAFIRKLIKKYEGEFKTVAIIQYTISVFLLAIAVLMFTWFPTRNVLVVLVAFMGAFMTIYYMFYRGTRFKRVLFPSFFAIVTMNFVFNAHMYPNLLRYESGNVAAQIASRTGYDLTGLNYNPYGMDFYYGKAVHRYQTASQIKNDKGGQTVWIYTDRDGVAMLRNDSVHIVKDTVLQHFHVSSLTARFLVPKTRKSATQEMHLLLARP